MKNLNIIFASYIIVHWSLLDIFADQMLVPKKMLKYKSD